MVDEMKIAKETLKAIQKQFDLDCNLKEAEEILQNKVYLSRSQALDGARIVVNTDLFFRAIIFMGKAYIMTDESIFDGCKELFKNARPEWFCEFSNLRIIDHILSEYDREIADTHIYFLPDYEAKVVEDNRDTKWFNEKEIRDMKDTNIFHNALCYSATQPDILAVAAMDGNIMKGMAGASLDGRYVRQIGIDVLEQYQNEGLATYLTTILKQKILKEGLIPFYGTSESHSISRNVAIHSGFLPAWAEIYVKRKTKE